MMLASGWATRVMASAAWLTSCKREVGGPGDGEQHALGAVDGRLEQRAEIADFAASVARSAPVPMPMPMSADPAPAITDFTSAKSRLIRPGVVMSEVMPSTPWYRTWSAMRKASTIGMLGSATWSSRSLGTTMSVSTAFFSSVMPRSACVARLRPSKPNGRVTTPMVSAPRPRAISATTGSAAGTGAAAFAGGDEHHVGALEDLLDLVGVLLGGALADLGVRARTQPAGGLASDVELHLRVGHQQRLRIGVDGDELDAPEACLDHPVHRVHAAPADADAP